MQLEHARRENELLRRISSLEAEMASLAAQLESERRELANKQRDLEKERAAAQLVLRLFLLSRSLVVSLPHQPTTLPSSYSARTHTHTHTHTHTQEMAVREKELQSLVDEQKAELLQQSQSLQRDVQSLRQQQQLTEERELALQERENRFGSQETVMADLQARSAQLGEMEERLMSEVRLRDEVEAEWQRLALTEQGIEQHKERLLLREERLNLRIQEVRMYV
jgi:hypothetical protein